MKGVEVKKPTRCLICLLCLLLSAIILSFSNTLSAIAEDLPAGVTIPKLQKTVNDPKLSNGKVYPFWGPVCQRYNYSVVYSDKEGRSPEYVKIYFNGKMLDMAKENPANNDYKKGVKYIYKYVPNKFGSNFYYFEASNGLGKARASIIDSPDNGPVLFDTDFKNNEIILIDALTGKEQWRYATKEEWVGAVVLSEDGKYLAAQTSNHIHLFDTDKNKPLWSYESPVKSTIGGDVKGGVSISNDSQNIFAALNGKALMFDKGSNKPIWTYNLEENGGGAYGVDIAKNGQYAAVAMAGVESDENSNVLILFDATGKKLWQYHSAGNWHEVNFSSDGAYIAGATGCPDRRGYIFSKDSAVPIIKSEPLSKESPIDESRISSDGSLVVFGVESSYGAIVLMDRNSKQIVWRYETSQGKSVRALAMTPSGELIGAGTFGGDILIFNKNSNVPTEQLKIDSAIGTFDMADDGSLFATGSADKKVRIFEKGAKKAKTETTLNEYVGELDISGNGKYIAAGTSGAVYFFETFIDPDNSQISDCKEIIEPPKEDTSLAGVQSNGDSLLSKINDRKNLLSLPVIIPIICAGLLLIFLAAYLLFRRKRNLPLNKKLLVLVILIIVISVGMAFYFGNKKRVTTTTDSAQDTTASEGEKDSPTTENQKTVPDGDTNATKTTTDTVNEDAAANSNVCGNSICEPNLGESKDSCAKDCSSGN